MRGTLVWLLGSVVCAPAGTSATAPSGPAPSLLVRGAEGLNKLVPEACATPCTEPLPTFATRLEAGQGGATFMVLDPQRCRVPGFGMAPQECTGVCADAGLVSIAADFGPIGPTTRKDLCHAIEHDRGVSPQGSCDEVCGGQSSCVWEPSSDRARLTLAGHVHVECAAKPTDEDAVQEPNQADASNSISP